jgi:hypothetical protein
MGLVLDVSSLGLPDPSLEEYEVEPTTSVF